MWKRILKVEKMNRRNALVLTALCATSAMLADDPKAGETWYVSTEKLVMREKPDGLSPALCALKYRDSAEVVTTCRLALPFDGDREKFPETLMPLWVKVKADGKTGYLPFTSLASEWLIGNQDPNEVVSADGTLVAKRGFSESENDAALASMRGFSESENGELAAMRGAAGSGRAATKADPAAVTRVLAARKDVSDEEINAFIAAGQLARGETRKLKEEAVEEEGFFGGFMKKSRKAGASGLGFASKLVGNSGSDNQLAGAAASAGKITSGLLYSEIGPVQEFQLGCVVSSRILPLYPVMPPDDPASVYVRTLGMTLAAASNDPMPYHGYMFLVVKSDEVNAFAVPGGFVFVTTGMLKFLKDEDELAAILGHEMGHMELRHGMKSVGKESVLKLFSLMKEVGTSSISGGQGQSGGQSQDATLKQLTALADELFGKLTTSIRNGYGIEMESQADWRSIQFSAALGYDTKAFHDVLERFKAEKGSYGGASYPAERGADVLKYREGFGCRDGESSGRPARLARYKAACGNL